MADSGFPRLRMNGPHSVDQTAPQPQATHIPVAHLDTLAELIVKRQSMCREMSRHLRGDEPLDSAYNDRWNEIEFAASDELRRLGEQFPRVDVNVVWYAVVAGVNATLDTAFGEVAL